MWVFLNNYFFKELKKRKRDRAFLFELISQLTTSKMNGFVMYIKVFHFKHKKKPERWRLGEKQLTKGLEVAV